MHMPKQRRASAIGYLTCDPTTHGTDALTVLIAVERLPPDRTPMKFELV